MAGHRRTAGSSAAEWLGGSEADKPVPSALQTPAKGGKIFLSVSSQHQSLVYLGVKRSKRHEKWVWASCCCWNKLPEAQRLPATQVCFLIVLEVSCLWLGCAVLPPHAIDLCPGLVHYRGCLNASARGPVFHIQFAPSKSPLFLSSSLDTLTTG